ncbi:MAG: methionine--tRNA ligase [Thermomicrobiales bacterium]
MTDARPPDRDTYYLTAAIDYPNGAPHIGHSLEKVGADTMRRYQRLRGRDARLTMGLDENSQHVVTAAGRNGVDALVWTDQMETAFRAAWASLGVEPDALIRTNGDPRHAEASRELYRRAQAAGDIYRSTYSGWYCPNCNAYYTDEDLVAGRCPLHPSIVPEWLEEENDFFALGKYGDRLLAHIGANPDFILPRPRAAEVVATLRSGLRDFSVSRAVKPGREPWGIPVPGDDSQVIYVWFDALTAYLTGIGFPDDPGYERYWPADAQVIGKDITRFHCLYWPAMLLSAGLPLPRHIVVHGFLTAEGQRISTTTGNVIDPVAVTAEFGTDPVRYYLLRDVSFASDGDFSRSNLIRRHNDDLANDLGNLLNRVVTMTGRYRGGTVPEASEETEAETDLRAVAAAARLAAEDAFDAWTLDRAIDGIWTLVRRTNQYLEGREPWKLAKDPANAAALDTTLASAAEAMRLIAIYLAPAMPGTADRMMAQLGLPPVADGDWATLGTWGAARVSRVVPDGPLFPRIETENVTATGTVS